MTPTFHPPFFVAGPDISTKRIILSVPHAGRDYPSELPRYTSILPHRFATMEDRHVDVLVSGAVDAGFSALIAKAPRLWIDLNRAENDIDPAMMRTPDQPGRVLSLKARGGLGLIPRRTAMLGDIWTHPIEAADLAARIDTIHRPYHMALSGMITAARARFGSALLLDMHSMPSLQKNGSILPAHVVIGDRFGRSADSRVTECVVECVRAHGLRVAVNAPYAGGYILERHAAPYQGVHAVQVEIDRRLYLDPAMVALNANVRAVQNMITVIAETLEREISNDQQAEAAE